MGQADPVSVFPGQQPVRKDPYGCSRMGCTGDGNPDDPVNIGTTLRIKKNPNCSLSLSTFHLSGQNVCTSVLVMKNSRGERLCHHHHLFIFSKNTDLHLCWLGKKFSVWQGCDHTRCNVTLRCDSLSMLKKCGHDYSDSWHVTGWKGSKRSERLVCLSFHVQHIPVF